MISIIEQLVTVGFAKGEMAETAMTCGENTLTIHEISGKVKLGKPWKDGDVKEFPKVILEFHKLQSIDSMIELLQRLKQEMKKRIENMESEELRKVVNELKMENDKLRNLLKDNNTSN